MSKPLRLCAVFILQYNSCPNVLLVSGRCIDRWSSLSTLATSNVGTFWKYRLRYYRGDVCEVASDDRTNPTSTTVGADVYVHISIYACLHLNIYIYI